MNATLTEYFVLLGLYYELIPTPDWWKDEKREKLVSGMDKLYPKLSKSELEKVNSSYCWDWYLNKIGEE